MTKFLAFIVLSASFFISCTNLQSSTKGLENEAFLEFLGNPNDFEKMIEVSIGNEIKFNAKVHSENKRGRKGNLYSIPTGSHSLKVYYNNSLIYSSQIFVSNQETKPIYLQ